VGVRARLCGQSEAVSPFLRMGKWNDRVRVEICYTYLNRIVPKSVHILADWSTSSTVTVRHSLVTD